MSWGSRARHRIGGPQVTGVLVLVGTPIGNLGDISARAAETLAAAELVCCEDTRRTGRLLAHIGASGVRMRRTDEHTEADAVPEVCELLAAGKTVAVVTDAGMPALNDPGALLVAAASAAGHQVTVVPGPSAGLAALALSGFESGRWCFEGFLPRKGRARAQRLAQIAAEQRTTVMYESPHRLAQSLNDLVDACGPQRRATVARELTKLHEEVVRGTLAELCQWSDKPLKGEFVVVVEGAADQTDPATDDELLAAATERVTDGMSRRDAAAATAADHGVSRRRVYNLLTAHG